MWELRDQQARWESPDLSATVDLGHPDAGLAVAHTRLGSARIPLHHIHLGGLKSRGPQWQEPLQDAWTRGDDLFAAYHPRQLHANQLEVYWRILRGVSVPAVEWIVSVHTGLLDDLPTTWMRSTLPATHLRWLPFGPGATRELPVTPANPVGPELVGLACGDAPGAVLAELPGGGQYLEAVHPADYSAVEVSAANGGRIIRSRLFPDRLEKGVIRRARLRGWFLPPVHSPDSNLELATTLLRQFSESTPPLTT